MAATVFRGAMNTGDSTLAGGTSLGNQVIRLFTTYQKIMSPTETPLTNAIGTGPTVNQKKIEWGSSYLSPHQVTLGAAVANNSVTSVVLAAGESAKVMVTDLFRLEDEIMWVTAINAGTETLTVVRGMGGTTAAAHTLLDANSVARVCELLSPAAQENADSPIAPVAKGDQFYNLPQLMDQAIQVSNREDNTATYEFGSGSRYDAYLERVMRQSAIKFEKLLFQGRRGAESSMVVGSGTPTTMGGLEFFTPNLISLAGAPITELVIGDMLQAAWERVGEENTPDTLFVGAFLKRAISSLWNNNRYSTVKDKRSTLVWDSVETDFGTLKFSLSRYVRPGDAYLLDTDDPKKHFYKGGEWKEVLLPSNGPYKRGRFTGDLTTSWPGEQKRVRITGAATTAAFYSNM